MKINEDDKRVNGGTRITFEFWSGGFYSVEDRREMLEAFKALAADFDSDMIDDSECISFEEKDQVIAAKVAAVREALNSGELHVSIEFPESLNDAVYEFGEDQ